MHDVASLVGVQRDAVDWFKSEVTRVKGLVVFVMLAMLSALSLASSAAALGLGERVCMPSWAGNMAEWYRAADVFALTSRSEGFGMVLVEAMAHGCAVVSVDCETGPRDIIRDGEDGLLVAQDDSAALAEGLARLMGDEALRSRLGARAVEVQERFAPQRIHGMWRSLFDELLAEREARGGARGA